MSPQKKQQSEGVILSIGRQELPLAIHLLFPLITEGAQTLNFGILDKHQKLGGMNWGDPHDTHHLKSVAFVEKH